MGLVSPKPSVSVFRTFGYWTFVAWRLWMFPLYTLLCTLRLVLTDLCFLATDDSVWWGVTFITIAIQMLTEAGSRLFWVPSCTDFTKTNSVVDDFVGRITTNLEFINSHLSFSQKHITWTLNVVFICCRGDSPSPSSSVTLVRPFLSFHTTFAPKTIPVLFSKTAMDCCPWYAFWPWKTDHWTLFFLDANRKRISHK
jgi:hypothetical protein